MTQPIQITDQVFAIPEPEDAWILKSENWRTDFVINMGYLTYPRVGKKKWLSMDGAPGLRLPGLDYNERAKGVIKLPDGNWKIICTTKELNAHDSLKPTLTSKNLDPNKNYILIKKLP